MKELFNEFYLPKANLFYGLSFMSVVSTFGIYECDETRAI